ncbi:MAG: hypothetical protein Q9160_003776 [Pyrenula sp. 1 TL-2023]
MGRGSKKRKRSTATQEVIPRPENDISLSSTIKGLQRADGSERTDEGSTLSSRPEPDAKEEKLDAESDSGEWEVAGRKRKRRGVDGEKTKYPELVCLGTVQAPIKLDELQRLVLYVLADGVAPSWLAYKHALHTRKVVMLMVPGLEKSLFDTYSRSNRDEGASKSSDTGDTKPSEDPSKSNGETNSTKRPSTNDDSRRKSFEAWKDGKPKDVDYRGNPVDLRVDELPPHLQPIANIFPQYWPVKAPGDSSMNRLHSPAQAILTAPLPISKEQAKMKGVKPPREGKSFVSVRTTIDQFIHSLEDLREAEYPIHPILCESPEDKTTEKARRDQAKHTADAGWADTNVPTLSSTVVPESKVEKDSLTAGYTVYALDCEMVLTDDGASSLARVSLIDWSGNRVLDELVKPSRPIVNYFTQFSGMTKAKLDPITTTLKDIQAKLLTLLNPTTILLGHSLESDLTALKLTHPLCIDTSLIYPHPRGPPLRSSLKFLSQKYLSREIQKGGLSGHDSVEDALAVLDLVKLKCEKGPRWGTSEAQAEPIFRRLARSKDRHTGLPRTAAIVDYGAPERGFGKEATYHIACSSDADILAGTIRAATGDPDGKYIPGSGADFTWARLRELETARGWRVDPSSLPNPFSSFPKEDPSTLLPTLTSTIQTISTLHASLPPCTLFIVYSGTGDPRELIRMQALQKTYKQEYRTKKWDDLTVKWTDVEEQKIKRATGKAREGMAFLGIT